MELVISELHLKKPPWTLRNKLIAEHLEPNKSVIDIGGGAGDILKYYKPNKYCNIDGMPVDNVDIILDLDSDYHLELEEGWDYSINSGILEWVKRVDYFLDKQKNLANNYIFTWHYDHLWGRMSFDRIESIINENYIINDTIPWGGKQKIYKCKAK